MKKFALPMMIALVATMLINLPVSQARQVRFLDVGAENFVAKIKQILYSNDFRQHLKNNNTFPTVIYPVLTDVVRDKSFDMPGKGLTAWSCYYGRENSVEEDGQIIFLVDGNGYIFEVVMINRRESLSAQAGAAVLMAFHASMNLTAVEGSTLVKNGSVWSSYNNRVYATTGQYNEYETFMSFQAFDS